MTENAQLALIGVLSTFLMGLLPMIGYALKILNDKVNAAKATAADTKTLLNGRMDLLLQAHGDRRYAEGKADGIATVSKAVADSPHVGMEASAIAQAVVDASKPSVDPGKNDASKKN